jgi:radical SAM superfamily enzyme YgiQ (UPF0313 family)
MKIQFVHEGRENLGIEYLSAVLKDAGHEVGLSYDQGLFGPDDNVFCNARLARFFERRQKIADSVVESEPDLVAFSVFTNNYPWALRIADQIKERVVLPIVFGGIHATLVPDRVIGEHQVDYVVAGEGEEAFAELVQRLDGGKDPDGLPNVWTKRNLDGEPPPLRPPVPELDSIPFPDKALFERTVNIRDDYLVITSRGCPCNCSYCCESHNNRIYHGKYFRRRSPENVLDELLIMKERYDYREVMFNDAIFFTDREWLRSLLNRFRTEIGVKFRCFGQVRFLDEEVAELLKRSGCYAIEFGVQTLNEDIRRRILRRGESNRDVERALEICDRFGLAYDVDHIFGIPNESVDDHECAAKFYSERRMLNRVKCHNLVYFPRLGITEYAHRESILSDGDVEDIENGRVTDFFHADSMGSGDLKKEKESFDVLFKLMPFLGRRGTGFFLKKRRRRLLRWLPRPLVMMLQVIGAGKKRDYRFLLYFRYYPLRIRRALFG